MNFKDAKPLIRLPNGIFMTDASHLPTNTTPPEDTMTPAYYVRITETDQTYRLQMTDHLLDNGFVLSPHAQGAVFVQSFETDERAEELSALLDSLHGVEGGLCDYNAVMQGHIPNQPSPNLNPVVTPAESAHEPEVNRWDAFRAQYPEVTAYLEAYNGTFEFLLSVKTQFLTRGGLSPRQVESVQRCMVQEQMKQRALAETPTSAAKKFSFEPGDKIEVRAWLAKKLKTQLGLPGAFRNFEVVKVENETHSGVMVSLKLMGNIAVNCHVCGRALDNQISKATGIGPVCAENIGLGRASKGEADAVIREWRQMVAKIGVVGPIWLPLSQIARRAF